MRNPFSDLDLAGPFAVTQDGEVSRGNRDHLRHFAAIAMAVALVCAGPIALLNLFNGSSAPLLVCAGLAFTIAVSALLDRQERRPEAIASQLFGMGVAAAALSFSSPGLFDVGVFMAVAALSYGLALLDGRAKLIAFLPMGAALIASLSEPAAAVVAQNGGNLGFSLIAAIAALAVSVAAVIGKAGTSEPEAPRTNTFDVVEDLAGAVVRYDAAGKLAYVSRSGLRLFKSRAYELSGGGLFERIHILDRPVYAKALSDLLDTGGRSCFELRIRNDADYDSAARYKWVELSLAAIRGTAGAKQVSIVGIFRDISVRKAIEDDLRLSRAQAEEASEAKTRFLATIGHELRTPLNAIVGFSDMMAEGIGGELSPTHLEYTGHIRQSGHHLLDVVNMLLDMSKIDAGKFELQAEEFAPQDLVDPCLQMVEQLGRDRNVSVAARIPDQLPRLVGDERACRQIMINLLSNAIKFSHDGGEVTLAMRRQGKMLAISVSDTGIGMEADTVKRIGEPFLQAQNGLSRRYEGTGLGLSIVNGLVSLHNGRLTVASEPGVGTRVNVLLPLDGPTPGQHMATIEHLHEHRRDTDEQKWQEDEKRSATS